MHTVRDHFYQSDYTVHYINRALSLWNVIKKMLKRGAEIEDGYNKSKMEPGPFKAALTGMVVIMHWDLETF